MFNGYVEGVIPFLKDILCHTCSLKMTDPLKEGSHPKKTDLESAGLRGRELLYLLQSQV